VSRRKKVKNRAMALPKGKFQRMAAEFRRGSNPTGGEIGRYAIVAEVSRKSGRSEGGLEVATLQKEVRRRLRQFGN